MMDVYEQCVGFLNKSSMVHRYVPLSIVQKAKANIDTMKLGYRGLKVESINVREREGKRVI